MRFYLTGRVTVEGPRGVVDQDHLPGRQGRAALVALALHRHHPLATGELAERIWPGDPPRAWEVALRALVSKLRGSLAVAGIDPDVLVGAAGAYQLRVPGAFVDVEEAANSLDRAEGALRRGEPDAAWGHASVAAVVTGRPLLPGEEASWLDRERERLELIRLRALDCLAAVWTERGEHELAASVARRMLAIAPLREASYRRLMHIHLAAGDRAQAVAVYARCRQVLGAELGVEPSPDTESVYLDALRTG